MTRSRFRLLVPLCFVVPVGLVPPSLAQRAQAEVSASDAASTSWRTLLEQALFARNYEGDSASAKRLYERALELARASGDAQAVAIVRRDFAGDEQARQGKAEQMIGRQLALVSSTPVDKRYSVYANIQWRVYPTKDLVQILNRCLGRRVVVGGQEVDLRPRDLLDIGDELPASAYRELLRLGMQNVDPLIRMEIVERMNPEVHLDLVVAACSDASRQVREEACQELDNWTFETEPYGWKGHKPTFLAAFDRQTRVAGQVLTSHRAPELLTRMGDLAPDSWWADEILSNEVSLNVDDGWTDFEVGFVRIVTSWVSSAQSKFRKIRLLNAVTGWMAGESASKGYPAQLAAELTELALSLDGAFDGLPADEQVFGDLISSVGTFADLQRLAPEWVRDPKRRDGDCAALFGMFAQQSPKLRDDVIALAAQVTQSVHSELGAGTEQAERVGRRCASLWEMCGANSWTDAEANAYRAAFEAIEDIPDSSAQRRMLRSFAVKSTHRPGEQVDAIAAPRWAQLVAERVGSESERVWLVQRLIAAKSSLAPAAALALRGKSPRLPGGRNKTMPYGDFLRQAFASDPEAALDAVLETVRSGWAPKPRVTVGRESIARRAGGSVRGRDGKLVPIPTRTVIDERDQVQLLPSLLCALPGEQAAQAVAKLWRDRKQPISRPDLIATLIYAQDQPEALDQLVRIYQEIDGPTKRADVLAVFQGALHPKARKLVNKALDDKSPLVRSAALAAAEAYLAMDRAKSGLTRPAASRDTMLFLSGMLKDEDVKVACGAAAALAATRSIEALPILVRRLKTADEQLAEAIRDAIRKLGER